MGQKIFREPELMEVLSEIQKERDVHQVLLVCGASFRKQKLYETLCGTLKELGIILTEFSDFAPNPKYESVIAGIEAYRQHHCDMIIAAGGGSAMDVAKCIKLFAFMNLAENCLTQEIVANDIPLLAIPTTAGTGSEATRFAVIYYEGNKQSVNHTSCIPEYVLMDPELLATLPMYQRKATMLDALCHAVESFWSVNAMEESQKYAAEAIQLVLKEKEAYLANTPEGNEQMLLAANLAGKAINFTQTTAGHAMAYKLTTLYGLAHGHAVALCVEKLWLYMVRHTENCMDERGTAYLDEMFRKLAEVMGCGSAEAAAEAYGRFYEELSLERPALQHPEELDVLAGSVNPVRLKNNPVRLDAETLRALYTNILKEGQ